MSAPPAACQGLASYRDAIAPGLPWALARRAFSTEAITRFAERRFLSGLEEGDIAYLWPGSSLRLYRAVKARGNLLVTERVNTLVENSIAILDISDSSRPQSDAWPRRGRVDQGENRSRHRRHRGAARLPRCRALLRRGRLGSPAGRHPQAHAALELGG